MKPKNDLFYAMSHGVNRATLKEGTEDERILFLNKLVKNILILNMIFTVSQINNQFGVMNLIMHL